MQAIPLYPKTGWEEYQPIQSERRCVIMLPKNIIQARSNISGTYARLRDGEQREKDLKARHEKELLEFKEEKKQIIQDCTKKTKLIFIRINTAASIMYTLVNKKFAYHLRDNVFSQPEMKWVKASYSNLSNVQIEEDFTVITVGKGEDAEDYQLPTFLLYSSEWKIAQHARKIIYKYKNQFKEERKEQRIKELKQQLETAKKQLVLEETKIQTYNQQMQKIEAKITKGENNE